MRKYTSLDCMLWMFLGVLTGLVYPSDVSAAEAGRQIERVIPSSAHLVMCVDDAAAVADRFNRTSIGAMLGSETWRPFREALRKDHVGCLLNPQPWFGVEWADVSEFSIPTALIEFSTGPQSPTTALIVDVQNNPAAAKALRGKAETYFRGRKAATTNQDRAGEKRIMFEINEAGGSKRQRIYLERNGVLAFVTSAAGAELLSKFWESEAKTGGLGNERDFQSVMGSSANGDQASGQVRWWLRPLPLAQSLRKPPSPGKRGSRGDWIASMERLGVEQVRAVGGRIDMKPDASPEWETNLRVVAPQPYTRALNLAVLKSGDWVDPSAWVHQSIDFWGLVYRDPTRWFDGLGSLFDEVVDPANPGAFKDVVDAIKQDPCGPRIDVANDVIPHLSAMLVQVVDHEGAKTPTNPDGRRVIVVLPTTNGKKLLDTFDAMFKDDDAVSKEQTDRYSLWSTKTGDPLFIATGQKKGRLSVTSLAVADNQVYLCTDKNWLLSILEGKVGGAPLTKHPRYNTVKKYLVEQGGKKAAAWGIAMLGGTLRPAYEQIRSGKPNDNDEVMREVLELLLFGNAQEINPELAKRLPAWKDVAPAVGTSGTAISPSELGFSGVWGIWPEQPAGTTAGKK